VVDLSASNRPNLPIGSDSVQAVVEQLGPMLLAETERMAWQHAATLVRDLFSSDFAAIMEFVGDDRGRICSSSGFGEPLPSEQFAIAPDAQATYIRTSGAVLSSGDIVADPRFTAPGMLTRAGVTSTLTAPFPLAEGGTGLLGVHARASDHFVDADIGTIEVIGRVLGSVIDRLRLQAELEVDARTDVLTGLENRAVVLAALEERLRCRQEVSALLIDLDGFKSVNDQHGHLLGDRVLRAVAQRITRSVEPGDRVGRLGGDEFLVLLEGYAGTMRAEQMIGHIEETIVMESRAISVSASIGISRSRPDDDVVAMLERADRMMYAAKALGRGRVRAEAPAGTVLTTSPLPSNARPSADLSLADEAHVDLKMVDDAIANLRVVVQPIVAATTGALHGVEALARGPEGCALEFPDVLFDAATTFGRLGELELAAKRLSLSLDLDDDLPLFINLEPTLLGDPAWFGKLADVWAASGSRRRVVAELTERSVMEHPGQLLAAVAACREVGWQIALDDVGSRSESLAALRWIAPDVIKLDMSLIRNENPAHSAHVVAAVSAYRANAARRDVIVIAEGVESSADAELADVLGADLLQGYRFGRPTPLGDLAPAPADTAVSATERPIPYFGDRIASAADLLTLSRHIEAAALSADCVVLATMQRASCFTRHARRQYRAMARRCGFVGVVGVEASSVPAAEVAGVALADLAPDDPLARCWHVLSMSPTMSLGLLATEIGPPHDAELPSTERFFTYRLVSEPTEVEDAVRRLLKYF